MDEGTRKLEDMVRSQKKYSCGYSKNRLKYDATEKEEMERITRFKYLTLIFMENGQSYAKMYLQVNKTSFKSVYVTKLTYSPKI